jgi:hypothetical protein
MAIVLDRRGRQLTTLTAAMLVLLLAGELHHHLSVKTVVLPRLFFELAELVLLLGCMVAGTLLIFGCRCERRQWRLPAWSRFCSSGIGISVTSLPLHGPYSSN